MQHNITLPYVNSYESYDQLNLNDEIFKHAAKEIIFRHHLEAKSLQLLPGTNVVFLHGNDHIIKIFPPAHREHFVSEVLVMKHLYNKLTVQTPKIEYEGKISGWPYIIMQRLRGILLEDIWQTLNIKNKTTLLQELGCLIREVHSLPTQGLEIIDCDWEQFIDNQIKNCVSHHESRNLQTSLIKQLPMYLNSVRQIISLIHKPVLLTGEYTPMNLLVEQKEDIWHISGLIDFGDSMLGLPEYDLLGPGAFLVQGDKHLLREFLLSYGYLPNQLTKALRKQLTALMLLHRYSNLQVQLRIPNWQSRVQNISDLEDMVWGI